MAKSFRKGRLGEEIKKIISGLLMRELKDPRLSGKIISVTGVDVSADGSYATVYITVLAVGEGDEARRSEEENVIKALESASGFIRNDMGKKLHIKHVPELSFKIDSSLEYGRHMSELIDSLNISGSDNEGGVQDDE